MEKGIGKVEVE
jgi:hypothetical protein